MSNNLAKLDCILAHEIIAEDTNHKLIVQTPAGLYIGKPYNPDNSDHPYVSVILQKIKDIRLSEYDQNNPTAFFLVDVEFRANTSSASFRMPYVCLFLDQILGVSIGNVEKPTEE